MSVAVAVLSGAADVGLGIHAAARALDLDFVPVVTEEYDHRHPGGNHGNRHHPHPARHHPNRRLQSARSPRLGGYHTEHTGEEKKLGK
jgi:putative molybdopterin biosynthesis protein